MSRTRIKPFKRNTLQGELILMLVAYQYSSKIPKIRVHNEIRRVLNFLSFHIRFTRPIFQHCCLTPLQRLRLWIKFCDDELQRDISPDSIGEGIQQLDPKCPPKPGTMPTNSERLEPKVAAGCWKEIYQVPNCVFNIIKAFIGKGSIDDVGVPCCKAFLSLTGDCKVEIFQNGTITPLIENFCTAIVSSSDSPPLPPVAPTPENGGGWEGAAPPVVAEPPMDGVSVANKEPVLLCM
ncbi:hypothetical protein LINGRAHAP2_LOCUS29120 [Linum grandiflorum]